MGIGRWIGRGLALGGALTAGGALFLTARHVLTTPQPLRSGLEGDAKVDEIRGKLTRALGLVLCVSVIDDKVLPLDVAVLAQAVSERIGKR